MFSQVMVLLAALLFTSSLALAPPHQETLTMANHGFFSRWHVLDGHAASPGAFGGLAVADLDGDGRNEVFVNGQHEASMVLKWNGGALVDVARELGLDDAAGGRAEKMGQGVVACDIDGDGIEEVYVVSSSLSPGLRPETSNYGGKPFNDALFVRTNTTLMFSDTLSTLSNKDNNFNGSLTATCVDWSNDGHYTILVGELGGSVRALDYNSLSFHPLLLPPPLPLKKPGEPKPTRPQRHQTTPRQSLHSLMTVPLLPHDKSKNRAISDVICLNSMGNNSILRAETTGLDSSGRSIAKVAPVSCGKVLEDPFGKARCSAVVDAGGGWLDVIVGNQKSVGDMAIDSNSNSEPNRVSHSRMLRFEKSTFVDITPPVLEQSFGLLRSIVTADFDNDGFEEIVLLNSATSTVRQPNVLLKRTSEKGGWEVFPIGELNDPTGDTTSAVAADIDSDGRLELIVASGTLSVQALQIHRTQFGSHHHYLRVTPLTKQGAHARGAVVEVFHVCGRHQLRVIDSGGGNLAMGEPTAHFGLAFEKSVLNVTITWPGGRVHVTLNPDIDREIRVKRPLMDMIDSSRGNAYKPTKDECDGIFPVVQKPVTPPPPPPAPPLPVDCYSGNGTMYRGQVSRTLSGHKCQDWASVWPNPHLFLPATFPNSGLDQNKCRNPRGVESEPWCFTIDGPRWEKCGIPKCTDAGADELGNIGAGQFSPHAAACAKDPTCLSFVFSPCPSEPADACPVGFLLDQYFDSSGNEVCACRRGVAVSCDAPPETACPSGYVRRQTTDDRCFCALLPPPPPPRIVGKIPLRVQVQFRECLKRNAAGPLRCAALMESLGYDMDGYGRGALSGHQIGQSGDSQSGNGTDSNSTDTDDSDGEVIVDPCPSSSKGVCEEGFVFQRRMEDGKEICSCKMTAFVLNPCEEDTQPSACGPGFVLEKKAGDGDGSPLTCTCSYLNEEESEDDGFWHGGCEHCHYGRGTCTYSHLKGWFCKCNSPSYTGPDCMHSDQ